MEAIVVVVKSRMVNQETQQAAATGNQNYDGAVLCSLNELSIEYCRNLKSFCWYNYCSEQQVSDDALPFFSQREVVAAQTSFCMLKTVVFDRCPKVSAVFPSTMIKRLQKLEYITVECCDSMRTIVGGENSKPTQLKEANEMKNQVLQYPMEPNVVQGGGSNSTEEAVMMEMFTFPCLRELDLSHLPKLDRFYSSSATSCGFNFPSLETLRIEDCPGVTTLFTQRPNGLVEAGDHDSDGVGAAFFGYCHNPDKSIPNMKSLRLWELENLTEIWKRRSDESCSDRVALELEKGDDEFRFLERFTLLFPSLQELEVDSCKMVKLFNNSESSNDKQVQLDAYTSIEQFLICSERVTSPLRSLRADCSDCSVNLTMEKHQDDLRLGLKCHLYFKFRECGVTNSQSLLPVASPSFCNVLTHLTVKDYPPFVLVYILTPLGATRLVHLTCLEIVSCDNLKQVVAEEADNIENEGREARRDREITFNHLKTLRLHSLSRLESFSSVNNNNLVLNFPSLEELSIRRCPKMKIFSNGVLTTPKLHQLRGDWLVKLKGDLNTAIQKMNWGYMASQ